MKERTKAYMAGVIDGDGHIGITKHPRYTAAIQFVNESKALMNWATEHFGGVVCSEKIPSGKPFYRWILYGKEAQKRFISEITPFLLVKRSQAQVLSRFLDVASSDYDPEKRNKLFLEIRATRVSGSVETDTQNTVKHLCAYAAGMVDTDGHIGVRTVKSGKQAGATRTRIEVVNTCKWMLDELSKHFGGFVHLKGSTAEGWTQRYRWILTDKKCQERFLLAALPYLIVKRERAKDLLAVIAPAVKIQPDPTSDCGRELAGTPIS